MQAYTHKKKDKKYNCVFFPGQVGIMCLSSPQFPLLLHRMREGGRERDDRILNVSLDSDFLHLTALISDFSALRPSFHMIFNRMFLHWKGSLCCLETTT